MADEKTEVRNAIDYIKSSGFFSESKYAWLRPLLEKILNDEDYSRHLDETLADAIPECFSSKTPKPEEPAKKISSPEKNRIKRIKTINHITNVGLITRKEPVSVDKDLSVFYGSNASGKSSIFSGLCGVLGRQNKRAFPSIYDTATPTKCELVCLDDKGKEVTISWSIEIANQPANIKIFDSDFSNYIVANDQVNEFQLAHLKSEYFSFFQERFESLGKLLAEKKREIATKVQTFEQALKQQLPSIFEPGYELSKQKIEEVSFTPEENEKLEKTKASLEALNQSSTDALIQLLGNTDRKIENVIDLFQKGTQSKAFFNFSSEWFSGENERIRKFNEEKELLEKSVKIDKLPKDWIQNPKWVLFIQSSIQFLKTLSAESCHEFDNKCVYCQQPLNEDAKKLILAYQKITDQIAQKLEIESQKIKAAAYEIRNIISKKQVLSDLNNELLDQVKYFEKYENINLGSIVDSLEEGAKAIDEFKEIDLTKLSIKQHETSLQELNKLSKKYKDKIAELQKDARNRKEKIVELQVEIKKFQVKQVLIDSKKNIIDYLDSKFLLKKLDDKEQDLSNAKRLTGSLETKFSTDEKIKVFKVMLGQEYEALGYTPPEQWNIKSITPGGVNKRVYNIADRKLTDIFSEGERKIHALADFIAEAKLNNFDGVYIFDDPVNSLDEDNMDLVAKRIKHLVEKGHQVIVFTHNLVFLNQLLNLSKDTIHHVSKFETKVLIHPNVLLGEKRSMVGRLTYMKGRAANFVEKVKKGELLPTIELAGLYDEMSGYLEDYVEKVVFKDIVGRYRRNIRMDSLITMKPEDLAVIGDIASLHQRTSQYCNRHSQPLAVPDPKLEKLLNDLKEVETKFAPPK